MNKEEMIENISKYIQGNTAWSLFSELSGHTRSMVLEGFFEHHSSLGGDRIDEWVRTRIGRELNKDEELKLAEIITAWREWAYCLSQGKKSGKLTLK
ncbi:hypothetical protein [Candidatus Berkiella aquae]|uniref:Uncharacterized protein n=1 Tax=Candidatus Berkiella aquae TaxID=295108 RepID=A0A0Q9YZ86_9GAMM|nr:hypothetical protein [Candidatus Berkiella aquae]MCS5711458.1 hypothetical protein [Candidatus Berkiella aquae]